MLLQVGDIIITAINFLPTIVEMGLFITILVFAIFILKKNQYRYGLFLLLSSIFMLIYYAIYLSINYPYLPFTLHDELGIPYSIVSLIILSISILFWALRITSFVFLFISVYFIYQTHKINRDQKSKMV